jgi:TIMELESS-interacting protein
MRYLEHWAHRLFPMMPFDDVLERIEHLGAKRDVQVKQLILSFTAIA